MAPRTLADMSAACIDDQFVCNLFDIIEEVSDDVNDPYHYPVIRVLVSGLWKVHDIVLTNMIRSLSSMSNSWLPPMTRLSFLRKRHPSQIRWSRYCLPKGAGTRLSVQTSYCCLIEKASLAFCLHRSYTDNNRRDLAAAADPKAHVYPLHHSSYIRVLLHE